MHYDFSTNVLYQNRKKFKPPPCLTCQMYENSLFTLTSKAATSNINESPVGSKHDSEKSVLLTIPSVSNFHSVNLDNSKSNDTQFDDFQKAIKNTSFYQQDNSSSFEFLTEVVVFKFKTMSFFRLAKSLRILYRVSFA